MVETQFVPKLQRCCGLGFECSGLATAPSFSGRLGGAVDRLWSAPLGGRLRRRFDQISAVELTLGGRLQGAALALRSAGPSRSKP